SIPSPHASLGFDIVAWVRTTSNTFSIKNAYKILKENSWSSKDEILKLAWKYQGPQRGILDGLSLLQVKQCERLLIQMDSLEVVEAIQNPDSKSSCSTLVRRIRQLLDSIRNWRLDHIPREENKETNQMAKMTFDTEDGLQLFTENPLVSFV
ncbi:hypothetical protein Goari_017944, partial [Gossypium aridum]|nr:hypothetical protein [Gossypium aridum]